MVKPPKTMQPENVDLSRAGRKAGRAFQADSFHHYMARKIDLQRQQFGLMLPPPPVQREELTPTEQGRTAPSMRESYTKTIPAATFETEASTAADDHKSGVESSFQTPPSSIKRTQPGRSLLKKGLSSSTPKHERDPSSTRTVRFVENTKPGSTGETTKNKKTEDRKSSSFIGSVLRKLKRRHGRGNKRLRDQCKDKGNKRRRYHQKDEEGDEDSPLIWEQQMDRVQHLEENCVPDAFSLIPIGGVGATAVRSPDPDLPPLTTRDFNVLVLGRDPGSSIQCSVNPQCHQNPSSDHGCDGIVQKDDLEISPISGVSPIPEAIIDNATPQTALTLQSPSIRRARPDLFFFGVVVKVNGFTSPDNETIKRLLQKHGGDFETYETERVTHIIAENLSTAKANVYKGQRRPRPVCTPSWIVESVRVGKLLPHGPYLLQELREKGQQQQATIQSMYFRMPDQQQEKEEQETSAIEFRMSISNMASNNSESILVDKGNKKGDLRNGRFSQREEESLQAIKGGMDEIGTSLMQSPIKGASSHDLGSPPGNTDKFINGKIRTIGTDPNFLDSYFSSSRLSFIGSYKQRTESSTSSPSKTTNILFQEASSASHRAPLSSKAKRLIFHVDMDCFFASVVLRNLPQYKNKPVAISHHGKRNNGNSAGNDSSGPSCEQPLSVPKNSTSECATCNYEARTYGIKKGMFLGQAKQLCPNLIVLSYDFKGYEEVSQQVLEILNRVAMEGNYNGAVEPVSCDEAYVELFFDGDDEFMESLTCHALEIAERIRTEIFETTQCTATIGVGPNKFLAKLATDKVKPNRAFVVQDYRELLRDLNLRDLHGVGWRTRPKLEEDGLVTVQDVWDLGPAGETELIRILGSATGKKIYAYCHGKDERLVKPGERKTVGAECNYGVRFDGPYGMDHFMFGLAKEVSRRMERIRLKGRRFTLKIKQRKKDAKAPPKFLGHGSCHNLSKSIDIPGSCATRDPELMKNLGMKLYQEMAVVLHDVRGMGIIMSKLSDESQATDLPSSVNTSGIQHWFKIKDQSNSDAADSDLKDSESSELIGLQHSQGKTEVQAPEVTVPSTAIGVETENSISHPPKTCKRDMLTNDERILDSQASQANDVIVVDDFLGLNETVDAQATYAETFTQIDLPPMSQIRMSQIEALPQDLKQQILARMKSGEDSSDPNDERNPDPTDLPDAKPICLEEGLVPMDADGYDWGLVTAHGRSESHLRFRQTDLKRMMKLQAVQSGQEQTAISLTQLEELPLEIRLQIANQDNCRLGVLSQHNPPRSKCLKDRPPRKSTELLLQNEGTETVYACCENLDASDTFAKKSDGDVEVVDQKVPPLPTVHTCPEAAPARNRSMVVLDTVDVFQEDLLPLKWFLDENPPDRSPAAVNIVIEFLTLVLNEGRLRAMVIMIRSIENRSDAWSDRSFIETIVGSIDEQHAVVYGTHLDVNWLLGRTR